MLDWLPTIKISELDEKAGAKERDFQCDLELPPGLGVCTDLPTPSEVEPMDALLLSNHGFQPLPRAGSGIGIFKGYEEWIVARRGG